MPALDSVKSLHQRNICAIKALLRLIAEIADRVVHAMEALHRGVVRGIKSVTQAVLHRSHAVLQPLKSKL